MKYNDFECVFSRERLRRYVFGDNWLRDSVLKDGIFYNDLRVAKTRSIIENTFYDLANNGNYTHSKLITELGFGIWKYMFNNIQYSLSGKCLLRIFPNKEKSTLKHKYNNTFVFNELEKINILRNRIAHHEPICISHPYNIDILRVTECYKSMIRLFEWMDIDHKKLLYGIDHVECIFKRIKNFQKILQNNYTC